MIGKNQEQAREYKLMFLKASMEKVFNEGLNVNKAKVIGAMEIDFGVTALKVQEYLKTLCAVYGWHDDGEEIRREAQTKLKTEEKPNEQPGV